MTTKNSSTSSGFTLVELQIAILIVALMAVLISSALRLSSKTWRQVSEQQDVVERRFLLAQYLRRHISNARFMVVASEEYGTVTSFFGDENQINFIAPFPVYRQNGELYWWNFKLEETSVPDHFDLVASYFPVDKDKLVKLDNGDGVFADSANKARFVIANNITELEFEYFYRDEEGDRRWLYNWQPTETPPLLIAIKINISEENKSIINSIPLTVVVAPRFADQQLYGGSFASKR